MAVSIEPLGQMSSTPPLMPALTPRPPTISFEDQHSHIETTVSRNKDLLNTVSWLVDRMQDQYSSFAKFEQDMRSFRKQADQSIFDQKQLEDEFMHRLDLLESAVKKNSLNNSLSQSMSMSFKIPTIPPPTPPPETGESGEEVQLNTKPRPSSTGEKSSLGAPSDASTDQMPSAREAADAMMLEGVTASISDLEAQVRSLSISMKKMENHIKHQEQQQLQRDQAQDEIQRMELAKITREIEIRVKDKDLEVFRELITSKLHHAEVEAKDDVERLARSLKENLAEKMTEVQSSVESIAANTEQQVRLLEKKIQDNDEHDELREKSLLEAQSDMRAKIKSLGRQLNYVAEQSGINTEELLEAGGTVLNENGEPLSPGISQALSQSIGSPKRPATSSGKLEQRLDKLEKRLTAALAELGVSMPLDSEDEKNQGLEGQSEGNQNGTTQSGSRPGSRPGTSKGAIPERVDRLEIKHEDLVGALEDTLGINLGSEEDGELRPDSPQNQRSARSRGGQDRLSLLEARINHLAATLGVEMPAALLSGETSEGIDGADPTLLGVAKPGSATQGPNSRLNLLDAKMDEVASALGLTPEELERYALSETKGNLNGIVVLRDQGDLVSPRMAGLIAGAEDKLTQLDARMTQFESKTNEDVTELDKKILDLLDGHDLRLRKLEDLNGIQSPPRSRALADLERRMNNLTNEDVVGSTPSGNKRNSGPLASPAARTSIAQNGQGGANVALTGQAEEVFNEVAGEVKRLTEETDDIKARLEKLDSALEALRAGSPPDVVKAALGSPRVDGKYGADISANVKAVEEFALRGETSAQAATLAAEECQRLKDELAEIVNAVNVPSVGLEDSLFETKPVDGEDLDLDDEVRDDAARQYVERQTVMEARLKQLEEQLDTASVVMPESEIFSSLKAVIKDVRRCLSRCELLYQLPEIRAFVKRFQRSLEVNAILHEKWIGPGAGKRSPPPEESVAEQDRVGTRELTEDRHLTRDSELSQSAPDLRSKRGGYGAVGKGNEKQKKKPFRTVVDWCRPHTPLKIDPMYKGATPPTGERDRGGNRSEERSQTHLPQIK